MSLVIRTRFFAYTKQRLRHCTADQRLCFRLGAETIYTTTHSYIYCQRPLFLNPQTHSKGDHDHSASFESNYVEQNVLGMGYVILLWHLPEPSI